MDESPNTAQDHIEGDYQVYEQAAEPIYDRRSDRTAAATLGYITVAVKSPSDRVVVWASPFQSRSAELARFANSVLEGDVQPEDESSSD